LQRRPFIAGNWKLNLDPKETSAHASKLREALQGQDIVDVAVFPTALSIPAAIVELRASGVLVGIQDAHYHAQGAFTGTNSFTMARTAGCAMGLIGHSERRSLFHDTNPITSLKIQSCLSSGLQPVLCVGETLEQRNNGAAVQIVQEQLRSALEGLEPDQLSSLILAYEPVWAIGTGVVATPDQAQDMHREIREWLSNNSPAHVSNQTRILYGGSVKPNNAGDLLRCKDIDGALVGGASLSVDAFNAIIQVASEFAGR